MANIDYITQQVALLIRRYGTRDPFEICKNLDIRIRYRDLGKDIKAYFLCQSRIKNIVINQRTSNSVRRILCSHELGHAVLHRQFAAMRTFQETEQFHSMNSTEYEANLFAAELLIDDKELIKQLTDYEKSFFDIAKELCVPTELLDFKLRILKNKGYFLEPPDISKASFLKSELSGCCNSSDEFIDLYRAKS